MGILMKRDWNTIQSRSSCWTILSPLPSRDSFSLGLETGSSRPFGGFDRLLLLPVSGV